MEFSCTLWNRSKKTETRLKSLLCRETLCRLIIFGSVVKFSKRRSPRNKEPLLVINEAYRTCDVAWANLKFETEYHEILQFVYIGRWPL
jgi:hypothetical protein